MINKYQVGGAAPQGGVLQQLAQLPKDQLKKIMAAFGKWAQSKGLNIQQLQGNEQALELAMTQFIQEMQGQLKGAVAAKFGAKLNYIRSLKGNAPEGEEVVYFKCGGQMKKKFVKKGAAGAKAEGKGMDAVKEFKKKKACGGSKMKMQDGSKMMQLAQANKERKNKNNKKESNKEKDLVVGRDILRGSGNDTSGLDASAQDYYRGYDDHEVLPVKGSSGGSRRGSSVKTTVLKCGGKAKKHLFGGLLGF